MADTDTLHIFHAVDDITPIDFELLVKRWFEAQAGSISSFDAKHRELLAGVDGEYEIDVSIRFSMFGGAKFLVLVECKKHSNPIKREVVQVLNDRLRSTGGHKGFIFSTAPFQSGALTYADKNGIALVQIASGRTTYIQATGGDPPPMPPGVPTHVGWHLSTNEEGHISMGLISENEPEHLASILENAI